MKNVNTTRRLSAWVLLSVFLPMLMLTTLHRHEALEDAEVVCVDCAHHVHHSGHLQAGAASIDYCVLCQLATTPYVCPLQQLVSGFLPELGFVVATPADHLLGGMVRQQQSRAPPFVA